MRLHAQLDGWPTRLVLANSVLTAHYSALIVVVAVLDVVAISLVVVSKKVVIVASQIC